MKQTSILVTGGAGYIGSHVVLQLRARGERVVVLDDLSRGFRRALLDAPLIVGGVLGNDEVDSLAEDRIGEELGTHAHRLAAAGCELLLARGFGLSALHGDPSLVRVAQVLLA